MKAYASLHTEQPDAQSINEVSYEGYTRTVIEFENIFMTKPLIIDFPIPIENKATPVKFLCISTEDNGTGDLLQIGMLPYLEITEGLPRFQVKLLNNPAELPPNINPIARMAWILILTGEMKAEDLHPKLYESINDELSAIGLPVIPVVRSGTASLEGKIHMMPSLKKMGVA